MVVIYHGNCFDGFTAAWVAKKARPDAILIPGTYGKAIPEVPEGENEVYMIDISYPREEMELFRQKHPGLWVLDHHKTAQAALAGHPQTIFNMEKSGARLAWEFFQQGRPPMLVQFVEDRDLWRFALPNSKEVNAYIQSFPRTLENWDTLESNIEWNPASTVVRGQAILRSETTRVEQMVGQVQWKTISGYLVPVVNASILFSEVGNVLCEKFPHAPFAAYYFDRGDGVRQWGLRSIGEFDVSEIAKQYGGGGHRNAAGFQESL